LTAAAILDYPSGSSHLAAEIWLVH